MEHTIRKKWKQIILGHYILDRDLLDILTPPSIACQQDENSSASVLFHVYKTFYILPNSLLRKLKIAYLTGSFSSPVSSSVILRSVWLIAPKRKAIIHVYFKHTCICIAEQHNYLIFVLKRLCLCWSYRGLIYIWMYGFLFFFHKALVKTITFLPIDALLSKP